jgi:hypothetical protein
MLMSSDTEAEGRAYWDGGPKKIQQFVSQHLAVCENNWVCCKLDLQNLVVNQPSSPVRARDCLKISNIVL